MAVRERKVETYLKTRVKDLGGICRKWVSPGIDGVPDQIVIFNSKVYFVEIKTTDGHLSIAQKREHDRLIAAGADVTTVYGKGEVDQFIAKITGE
jgi:hypothetical protein